MKLYYAAGACSLSPHIIALEAVIPLALERVDTLKTPHLTETGRPFTEINPTGYVPALELDDGSVLTEGAAIVQYLADLKPEAGLVPPAGTIDRVRVQSWLSFVGAELHKAYSPWLFHAKVGAAAQDFARRKIADRLSFVEAQLTARGPYLTGDRFAAGTAARAAAPARAPPRSSP